MTLTTKKEKLKCSVYRTKKKEGLYLIVESGTKIQNLNETLLVMFGEPEFSFEFELYPERQMPHDNASIILASIKEQGYFLQLPPTDDESS